jgi:recombination protein RecR
VNTIQKLEALFKQFPGIGPRQAKRFVYFLLTRNPSYLEELKSLIAELKKETSACQSCFRYFPNAKIKQSLCPTCSDQTREENVLMVVSYDVDFENIEKSGAFKGKYFILGGVVPILESEPEKKIRINELKKSIAARKSKGLGEIIFAFNTNPEGENTLDYVKEEIAEFAKVNNIKISTLGRGLSTGAELEYSDTETLKNAVKNRQ